MEYNAPVGRQASSFLGALGEYAVMGIKMATEEINAAGGVLGR